MPGLLPSSRARSGTLAAVCSTLLDEPVKKREAAFLSMRDRHDSQYSGRNCGAAAIPLHCLRSPGARSGTLAAVCSALLDEPVKKREAAFLAARDRHDSQYSGRNCGRYPLALPTFTRREIWHARRRLFSFAE